MNKKNAPEWHEPVEAIIVEVDDPMDDMIEVGEIVLVDGPIDPVPLSAGPREREEYHPPRPSAGPMPDFGDREEKPAGTITDKIGDKVKDVTQKTQDAAQGIAGKVQDKVQDAAHTAADKAQDVTQKLSETASTAKTAVGGALDTVKSTAGNAVPAAKNALGSAAGKISTVSAAGAQSAGSALWTIVQRNPLQAIVFLASLVWLIRSNAAAASQPPVSLSDAASKVGTVAGQVQAAAGNLSAQVQDHTQRGAGWFSRTLQENPLAIGAMAIVFGAGLGFAVPESGYEHQLLGETRDKLADKAQEAAQDLTQKVTSVAQTAVHEAVETAKEEAKNQGLTA